MALDPPHHHHPKPNITIHYITFPHKPSKHHGDLLGTGQVRHLVHHLVHHHVHHLNRLLLQLFVHLLVLTLVKLLVEFSLCQGKISTEEF